MARRRRRLALGKERPAFSGLENVAAREPARAANGGQDGASTKWEAAPPPIRNNSAGAGDGGEEHPCAAIITASGTH